MDSTVFSTYLRIKSMRATEPISSLEGGEGYFLPEPDVFHTNEISFIAEINTSIICL
jgi:hypothetical protein